MYYYYLISSNINSFVAKRAMLCNENQNQEASVCARRQSERPGCSPAVQSSGRLARSLSGLLTCRASIRLGCLLADLLGNVGGTNIRRLLSACRSIVGQRGILQVVCVAGSQHGVRATNFVIRDAGTSS